LRRGGTFVSTRTTCGATAALSEGGGLEAVVGVDAVADAAVAKEAASIPIAATTTAIRSRPPRALTRVCTGTCPFPGPLAYGVS
jgi:hypothetical protein